LIGPGLSISWSVRIPITNILECMGGDPRHVGSGMLLHVQRFTRPEDLLVAAPSHGYSCYPNLAPIKNNKCSPFATITLRAPTSIDSSLTPSTLLPPAHPTLSLSLFFFSLSHTHSLTLSLSLCLCVFSSLAPSLSLSLHLQGQRTQSKASASHSSRPPYPLPPTP